MTKPELKDLVDEHDLDVKKSMKIKDMRLAIIEELFDDDDDDDEWE